MVLTADNPFGEWLDDPKGGEMIRELLRQGGVAEEVLVPVRGVPLQQLVALSQGAVPQALVDHLVAAVGDGDAGDAGESGTAPPTRPRWRAFTRQELALIAVTAVWGGTFLIVHTAMAHTGPMFFVGLRFVSAGLISMIIFRRVLQGIRWQEIGAGAAIQDIVAGEAVEGVGAAVAVEDVVRGVADRGDVGRPGESGFLDVGGEGDADGGNHPVGALA